MSPIVVQRLKCRYIAEVRKSNMFTKIAYMRRYEVLMELIIYIYRNIKKNTSAKTLFNGSYTNIRT